MVWTQESYHKLVGEVWLSGCRSVVLRRTVCYDIYWHFDNLNGSHCQSQVNCESSVDVICLQLLSWVVNELVVLLVVCQLTCDVVGYKDCKAWLVRFDASFVTQTVRWFIVSNISRFVYCLSVLLLSSISHL